MSIFSPKSLLYFFPNFVGVFAQVVGNCHRNRACSFLNISFWHAVIDKFVAYFTCKLSKITVFILPNIEQETTVETLGLWRSCNLGCAVPCISSLIFHILSRPILNALDILLKNYNCISASFIYWFIT